jgi:hypothetical protein
MNAPRLLNRTRARNARYIALSDITEAPASPRNGEPVANDSRNNAYDMAVAGPLLV